MTDSMKELIKTKVHPPKKVDLLSKMNLDIHRISGEWCKNELGLCVLSPLPYSRVILPYLPPEEYDFRFTFTQEMEAPVNAILAFDRLDFVFELAPGCTAFAMVNGEYPNSTLNPTARHHTKYVRQKTTNCQHEILLKVRSHRLAAFLDGQCFINWRTDYRGISIDEKWKLPIPALGLGAFCNRCNFSEAEVVEVTGQGYLLPDSAFHRSWKGGGII